jgi:ABC-2 type transport system permease protein
VTSTGNQGSESVQVADAAPIRPLRRAMAVWRYRELLVSLTRKELKVKYKNSALGFMWSLLNPAMYLVVFYVVFELVLESPIPNFAIFMLCGLLPWNLFSTALQAGTGSVVANASLVGKVWFPREILPLATVGAAIVNYLLQTLVLIAGLIVFQYEPSAKFAVVLPLAFLALVVLVSALAIFLSAVNVSMRDTSHLIELLLLAWFWMTPIIYAYQIVADKLGEWSGLFLLNPVTSIVIAYQRAIYNQVRNGSTALLPDESVWWYLRNVGIVLAVSTALLYGALMVFSRLEGDFAEDL